MVLYFAYGSNRAETLMTEKLDYDEDMLIGKGVLKGYTLDANNLNIKPSNNDNLNIVKQNKESSIEGRVFELNDENIEKLDFSMGLVSGYCYRKPVQVETEKGMVECYIYVETKLV